MKLQKLKRALEDDLIDFAEHTSAHGIPRAYVSLGLRRTLWLLLFMTCLLAFGYQAYLIILRFLRNDIIVGVEIKFEQIKFPAVTVCNINAYKNSAARQISTIRNALEAFELAIDKSEDSFHVRRKRSESKMVAIDVPCSETDGYYSAHKDGYLQCTCAHFTGSELYWNCHPHWRREVCRWDRSLTVCRCFEDMCIEEDVKMTLKWPLDMVSNGTRACIHPKAKNDNTPSFCSKKEELSIEKCSNCDWYSRCELDDNGDQECLCDRDQNCFAMKKVDAIAKRDKRGQPRVHEKMLSRYDGLLAIYSFCDCKTPQDCSANKEKDGNTTCLCFFNKKNDQVWPCYPEEFWEERKCGKCNTFGDCTYTSKPKKAKNSCLCAKPIHMCVRVDPPDTTNSTLDDRLVKFWDIMPTTTPSPVVKKTQEREKAYGYTGVKDRIALRAKAMENIIFAVDALTEEDKWRISYNKSDFILKCSFNGKECNVHDDFIAYLDPTFGACFTFVASSNENMTSERAGPSYGLRLEVFVNVTEYLPTTEAAGVRLTVHAHDEQPFPDTGGFSAPTGFVSSFGIKLKSMERLPAPYGDCVQDGKNDDFIYVTKNYSTEGCQRSCVQKHLSLKCGCGDPRFPPFQNSKNCPVDDPVKRECIKSEMQHAITQKSCSCKQPCQQQVFSVSYSASRWPAVAGDLSGCPHGMAAHHCLNYKREQGSMVEVYFEQLNYESLLESEAYGLPNLLSDFGGQLGLWMGVSVITIMEILILLLDLIFSLTGVKKTKVPVRKSFSSFSKYSITRSNDYSLREDKDNRQEK